MNVLSYCSLKRKDFHRFLLILQPDAKEMELTAGSVEFRDVHFHYDPAKPILKGLSFTVSPGQTVAIVSAFLFCQNKRLLYLFPINSSNLPYQGVIMPNFVKLYD